MVLTTLVVKLRQFSRWLMPSPRHQLHTFNIIDIIKFLQIYCYWPYVSNQVLSQRQNGTPLRKNQLGSIRKVNNNYFAFLQVLLDSKHFATANSLFII